MNVVTINCDGCCSRVPCVEIDAAAVRDGFTPSPPRYYCIGCIGEAMNVLVAYQAELVRRWGSGAGLL